jgi:hypothetical protein
MRLLYLIIPGAPLTRRLIQELSAEWLEADRIRLVSRRADLLADLPVPVTGLRPPGETLGLRALAGAALALVAALLVVALGLAVPSVGLFLLAVTLAGAVVGALSASWGAYPQELRPIRAEVGRDDVVMLVDLPDERLEPVEEWIKKLHPEIRAKGVDPRGSPPFP